MKTPSPSAQLHRGTNNNNSRRQHLSPNKTTVTISHHPATSATITKKANHHQQRDVHNTARQPNSNCINKNHIDIDAQMMVGVSTSHSSSDTNSSSGKEYGGTTMGLYSCDFYDNPTILSRLILHQKYAAAVQRLAQHPIEARIWVCRARRVVAKPQAPAGEDGAPPHDRSSSSTTKKSRSLTPPPPTRSSSSVPAMYNPHQDAHNNNNNGNYDYYYSYRQLPIHTACQNLGLYDQQNDIDCHHSSSSSKHKALPSLQAQLERLLARLIITYPAGCKHPDHAGHYPLHSCIRSCYSSLGVIALLLTAAPSVLSSRDGCYNCTALETNRKMTATAGNKQQRDRIDEMLIKGRIYWEVVRHKAMLKRRETKQNHEQQQQQQQECSHSLDHETVWSDSVVAVPHTHHQQQQQQSETKQVKPLAWSQLEQRCNVLEQLLTETMRQNHISSLHTKPELLLQEDQRHGPRTEAAKEERTVAAAVSAHPTQNIGSSSCCCARSSKDRKKENRHGFKEAVQRLSIQNRTYQNRIADLEENVQDLLWIGGSNNASGDTAFASGHSSRNMSDCVVESNAVSSLSLSDSGFFTPTNRMNQPRGMFGETSSVSPIFPSSFDTNDVMVSEDNDKSRSNDDIIFPDEDTSNIAATSGYDSRIDRGHLKYTLVPDDSDDQDGVASLVCENDSDSDLDSILAEAEFLNGSKLSSEVVRAWKAITADCYGDDFATVKEAMEKDETSEFLVGEEYACSYGLTDTSSLVGVGTTHSAAGH